MTSDVHYMIRKVLLNVILPPYYVHKYVTNVTLSSSCILKEIRSFIHRKTVLISVNLLESPHSLIGYLRTDYITSGPN